jgi:hypothetical protein
METLSYIAIVVIFLSGIIPVTLGIIEGVKENKRFNEMKRAKGQKHG